MVNKKLEVTPLETLREDILRRIDQARVFTSEGIQLEHHLSTTEKSFSHIITASTKSVEVELTRVTYHICQRLDKIIELLQEKTQVTFVPSGPESKN